jgi:hypothetical protein
VLADRDPIKDNDETVKSTWSNWCGPSEQLDPAQSYLDPAQRAALYSALSSITGGKPPPLLQDGHLSPPEKVFQILSAIDGNVLLTFPDPQVRIMSSNGSERMQTWYIADEFAELAREVCKSPKEKNVGATTSCTTRFKSKHPL